jgi:sirohydrochlorin cobaltochelatase
VPVVQTLLLLCGLEFHDMIRSVRRFWPGAPIGLPLLSGDGDVVALTEALAPVVEQAGDEGLLWVGHGTGHPSGLAYQALTAVWRQRFGPRVALGLLSGGPTPREIAAGFRAAGMQRVRLRPLMLLAGTHFWRDMAGDGPGSWKSRLQIEGLEVVCDPQALMESPGVAAIFGDHLQAALDRHPAIP